MNKLIILRHGESIWNLENRFTGWTDVPLTKKGIQEASNSGKLIKEERIAIDIVFTSFLDRAINTMKLCLKEIGLKNIPIIYKWQLNERHYGDLQGKNKAEIAKEFGKEQVQLWRRSYSVTPPPINRNDQRHPRFDKKYKDLKEHELPSSECLKDTVKRVVPIWKSLILDEIKQGKNVLIVAHGNSIRALIKYFENISDSEIINLNIPTGIPLVYRFCDNLKISKKYYLGNEDEISKKIDLVKNQAVPLK